MRVLGDKIMIKVSVEEEKTESGILLANAKAERRYYGTVVSVGTDPEIEKAGIKEGVTIFYPKGMNTEIIKDDVKYDIVSVYDVIAIGEE